jgi:hypothetical protein
MPARTVARVRGLAVSPLRAAGTVAAARTVNVEQAGMHVHCRFLQTHVF